MDANYGFSPIFVWWSELTASLLIMQQTQILVTLQHPMGSKTNMMSHIGNEQLAETLECLFNEHFKKKVIVTKI